MNFEIIDDFLLKDELEKMPERGVKPLFRCFTKLGDYASFLFFMCDVCSCVDSESNVEGFPLMKSSASSALIFPSNTQRITP